MLEKIAPGLFVALWSTGFIGAKYGLPYAEPMTLLGLRMAITLGVFALLVRFVPVKWPRGVDILHSMVVGLLIHGVYLGGVFYAIFWGMPPGLSALLVSLKPLVTAVLAVTWFKDKLHKGQVLGLGIGILGVGLVLQNRLSWNGEDPLAYWGLLLCFGSLMGISLGSTYQKRFCPNVDLMGGMVWQYVASFLFFGSIALSFETMEITWTWTFIAAVAWLVLALSVLAILVLLYLVRRGEMAKVSSLFYLVPPVTAFESYLLFDETFGLQAFAGLITTVFGVYLIMRPQNKPSVG